MKEWFRRFSSRVSIIAGSYWVFLLALAAVIIWGMTGPIFHFSENWQLVINTGTTIITFLMVFLIQNTQNRESKALHLKIDELLYKTKTADNSYILLEDIPDEQLKVLEEEMRRRATSNGS